MINLETSYMGLKLRNPLIVSSSGLTNRIDKIINCQENGAGAVVLKSLFEEQLNDEANVLLQHNAYSPEAIDYIKNYSENNSVDDYLKLITRSKTQVSIPIIASINCINTNQWINFAKRVEEAGADAIELNINILPTDRKLGSEQIEQKYFDIVKAVKQKVRIPLAVKIGQNFSNLPNFVDMLGGVGASAVVLFNRFYQLDFDIEKYNFTAADVFSTATEYNQTLRWVAIISAKTEKNEISASTGIHTSEAIVKQLLAGAQTVQVCSVLYKHGIKYIAQLINGLESWMQEKGYDNINQFRGILNYRKTTNPTIYERTQFMRYFSNIE